MLWNTLELRSREIDRNVSLSFITFRWQRSHHRLNLDLLQQQQTFTKWARILQRAGAEAIQDITMDHLNSITSHQTSKPCKDRLFRTLLRSICKRWTVNLEREGSIASPRIVKIRGRQAVQAGIGKSHQKREDSWRPLLSLYHLVITWKRQLTQIWRSKENTKCLL